MVSLGQRFQAQHNTGMDPGAAVETVPGCCKAVCGQPKRGLPTEPLDAFCWLYGFQINSAPQSSCANATQGCLPLCE